MNESQLRDLLPPERPLPAARRREMKERLRARIEGEGTVRRVRSRLPVPGAAVAAGVVALAFVAGAVAVMWGREGESVVATDPADAGNDGPAPPETTTTSTPAAMALPERDRTKPDSEDVDLVMDRAAWDVHGPGWRPHLSAEQMVCATPEGETEYIAYHFPMQDAVTADDFAHGCTQSADEIEGKPLNGGVTTEGAEVCVVGEAYFQEIEDFSNEQPGPTFKPFVYPMPFVALDGRSCDEDQRPITDEDLAEINRLRAIEASVLAAPQCSTVEAVEQWAQAWLDEEGIDLPIYTSPEKTEQEVCYSARIEWKFGAVGVALQG